MANPLIIPSTSWGYIHQYDDPAEYEKVDTGNPEASRPTAEDRNNIAADFVVPVDARTLIAASVTFTIVTALDAGETVLLTCYDADDNGTFAAADPVDTFDNVLSSGDIFETISEADGTGIVTKPITGDTYTMIQAGLVAGLNIAIGAYIVFDGEHAESSLVLSRAAGVTLTLTFDPAAARSAHYARMRNS